MTLAAPKITENGITDQAIRIATVADIPTLVEFAKEAYGDRLIGRGGEWVKSGGGAHWLQWCISNPDRLVLIGANSVGIAQVSWHYGFEKRGRLDVLVSRPGSKTPFETLKMVRIMLDWAKEKGATGKFKLDADTGVDFEPFAKRLGGVPVTMTRYEIPL